MSSTATEKKSEERAIEFLTSYKENYLFILEELLKIPAEAKEIFMKKLAYRKKIVDLIPANALAVKEDEKKFLEDLLWDAKYLRYRNNKLLEQSKHENYYYYDLIELKNGSHIPVTQIKPFWRKFFEKRKPNIIRTNDFFLCPICKAGSFFSQWSSYCNWCAFNTWDYYPEDHMNNKVILKSKMNRRNKRQRQKNRLLKSGLWVFRVHAYVMSDKTKDRITEKKKVREFLRSERL